MRLSCLQTALGAVFLWLAHVVPAAAEAPCGERAAMVAALEARFGERVAGHGLAGPNALVELFLGPEGGWTLLVSDARGLACVLAAGEAWDVVPAQAPAGPES